MTRYVRQPPPWLAANGLALLGGGEVDEYAISLRVIGEDLDPDEVSALLHCKPDSSSRKGDPIGTVVDGKPRLRPHGSWQIRAPAQPGEAFEPQVDALLNRTTQDPAAWQVFVDRGYRVDLFCGVFVRSGNRGMSVHPPLLKRLASLGISLELDIYAEAGDARQ